MDSSFIVHRSAFAVLALSDGWVVGMWISNLAATVVLGIVLAWVANRTRRIESLEASKESMTARLVESQLAAKTGELMVMIKGLTTELASIDRRLAHGDRAFERMNEAARNVEAKLAERVEVVKDYVRDNCASKEDVRDLGQRMAKLETAVVSSKRND